MTPGLLVILLCTSVLQSAGPQMGEPGDTVDGHPSQQLTLGGVTLSGFVETSYTYSTQPAGSQIVGRLFDRLHNQFMLDGVKLGLDRAADASRFTAGFHVDLLLGQDASPIQARGLSLGDQGDVPQAYILLNIPTADGRGVQLKAGKFLALPGVESGL